MQAAKLLQETCPKNQIPNIINTKAIYAKEGIRLFNKWIPQSTHANKYWTKSINERLNVNWIWIEISRIYISWSLNIETKKWQKPKHNINENKMNKRKMKASNQIGIMCVFVCWILHVWALISSLDSRHFLVVWT